MLPQVNKKAVIALTLALVSQPLWAEESAPGSIGEHFKTLESYRKDVELNQAKANLATSQFELDKAEAAKKIFELKSDREIKAVKNEVAPMPTPSLGKSSQRSQVMSPPVLPSMETMSSNQAMSLIAVRADNETNFQAKIEIGDSSEWHEKHEMVGNWRIVTISANKVELFDEKTKQSKTLKFK